MQQCTNCCVARVEAYVADIACSDSAQCPLKSEAFLCIGDMSWLYLITFLREALENPKAELQALFIIRLFNAGGMLSLSPSSNISPRSHYIQQKIKLQSIIE